MIKSFVLMIQFLTRIPIPVKIEMNKKTVSKGLLFFPLIGMMVGGISWLFYYSLSFVDNGLAAFGAVLGAITATGGLHLDGLADTCDGLFSARSGERILEIMKDSRTGTFGVIAIVLDLLARYIIIKALNPESVLIALVIISGASRLIASMLVTFGRSIRFGGLGSLFSSSASRLYFWISAVVFTFIGILSGEFPFICSLLIMLLFAFGLMRCSYKKIGGLTGDVYGAGIEMTEILGLITFLVVKKWS
ncbi:MAG: adenosylcobinamide-GDP ribazoletransferase [Acetivibrionales bacterium]|jgi:adenosylcobinamide-GDP ribazoletransferase